MGRSGTSLYLRAGSDGAKAGVRGHLEKRCRGKVVKDAGWLPAAAGCLLIVAFWASPRQLDLSWNGECELLLVLCLELSFRNRTVCSKHLYLALSESPTFPHPRPLLLSVAAMCALGQNKSPLSTASRSWAPSFTAYKLKGG